MYRELKDADKEKESGKMVSDTLTFSNFPQWENSIVTTATKQNIKVQKNENRIYQIFNSTQSELTQHKFNVYIRIISKTST